ncbi:glycoside hydrolase superfamily, partial [Pseudomassariella vexata]
KMRSLLVYWLLAQSASVTGQLYTNESEVPYYGLSPPVYPTPEANGTTSTRWAIAHKRAKAMSSQMTLEEKANITRGYTGQCTGNSGAVPRLGIPSLCMGDAPLGVRGQEFVSSFPAGIHVAATWDRGLMYRYGEAIGAEYKGKGLNIALGPVAGPLGRVVRGGRNWEGLSNDPYLAGEGMGEVTRGIQDQGVMATPKHFLLNEQEFRRLPTRGVGESISSNVDDRTIHELYMFPFMNGLKEGAVCIMCSYQRINNSYSCQNSKLLNGLLKTELGFEGFVLSDWGGQQGGVASANSGLDLVMPSGGFWGKNLTDAVGNGSVSAERVTDMATRILASWYYMGQDNGYPSKGIYSNTMKHAPIDVQGSHRNLIREIGAAGTVLVKNVNKTLPLQRPTFLCVYGYDATLPLTPWVSSRFGGGYDVNFGWNTFNGTLIMGGGSGSGTPPYVISPFQAIQERITKDNGIVRWDFVNENPAMAFDNADACLVFINAYASESFDRVSLTDDFSDRLVANTAAQCVNTIVVIHSTGIRTVDAWIDNPNVTAVLFAGVPGQESGNSIVDILWGSINPSGRLPYTVAKNESDYGNVLNSTVSFDAFPQDNFTEGLYIDYRAFDKNNIEPRYEFGYGLSYTTFAYADLVVTPEPGVNTTALPDPDTPIVQGGHPDLWEVVATVTASVTNTGDVAGHEVAQLYVGIPSSDEFETPVRQLRGFQRLPVRPGESQSVLFRLTRRDLSVWDVVVQQWRLQEGEYKVYVGASSRDLRLNGTLEITH